MNKMSSRRKLKSMCIVTAGGAATFALISIYKQNEDFYKKVIMPAVHLFDPETAHRLAILAGKYRLIPKSSFVDPDSLKVNLFNRDVRNPIGIAAGFDKHGEAVEGLNDIGFGFIEVGSVTPKPQGGNEKPRVFRLEEDLAVINRYGFNSDGHDVVYERLRKLRADEGFKGTVGINLGKNKESEEAVGDYVEGIRKFGGVSDYLVINVSSPNTPGLRKMQGKKELENLLTNVVKTRDELRPEKPLLFLKLAPDLSRDERKDVADVIKKRGCRIDGLIISNTTVERPESLRSAKRTEAGGLSGEPVKDVSTRMIAEMYKLTGGGMTIIGVGGVGSGEDAYEKIKAGASAVQIYTSLVYSGPFVVTKIKRELAGLLEQDGFKSVAEAVGKGV